MSTDSCPGYSSSDPLPANLIVWECNRGRPKALGSCTRVGDQEETPDLQLWPGPAICRVNQQAEDLSVSLSLPLSVCNSDIQMKQIFKKSSAVVSQHLRQSGWTVSRASNNLCINMTDRHSCTRRLRNCFRIVGPVSVKPAGLKLRDSGQSSMLAAAGSSPGSLGGST